MIRIGSRGSDLALWQARYTQSQLKEYGIDSEIIIIKTQGDQIQYLSFSKMEGKGFFTKEIEEALLENKIDLAVHSHKDLPTVNPEGLIIGAVSYRENCSDVLLIKPEWYDPSELIPLKSGAKVGTSSVRRRAQLEFFRSDINIIDLRGNVPTRIEKLKTDDYDAILLAQAGINRLNLDLNGIVQHTLAPQLFVPAPAQGVLAYQIRENDAYMAEVVKLLHNENVSKDIELERKTLNLFDGGCQLPLGVYADNEMVYAAYKPNSTSQLKRLCISRDSTSAEQLVAALTKRINKKVFISRNHEGVPIFKKILSAFGCDVVAESLIRFEAIVSKLPDIQPDWLFFTSRNSVKFGKHLLENYPNVKIGAVGQSTARSISSLGFTCEFIGDDQLSTDEIGHVFSNLAKGNVFFIEASNGNKTIQKHSQGHYSSYSIPVYETNKRLVECKPIADIYAFTSPSNVKSYIEQFGLPEGDVFAIGNKTGETLKKFGFNGVVVSDSHSIHNVADCIAGIAKSA